MAERNQPESPYQRSARKRLPYHTRVGDGPYALVDDRRGTAELFDFEMLALTELSQRNNSELHLIILTPEAVKRTSNVLRVTGDTVEFRK